MAGREHKGFTLIELLVVIAIIALLLAILMPSLNRVRKQAKFVACKSNLKSYGLMAFMYADDNDSVMPNAWTSFYNQRTYRNEPHRYCRWHNPDWDLEKNPKYAGPFWPYLKGKDIHICPAFPRIAKLFGTRHPEHVEGVPVVPNYNYSMNSYLSEKKIHLALQQLCLQRHRLLHLSAMGQLRHVSPGAAVEHGGRRGQRSLPGRPGQDRQSHRFVALLCSGRSESLARERPVILVH